MSIVIDEVYVAHIKSMFDHFDDEIIWSAIYERGYDKNCNFNIENVLNYLLELSDSDNIPEDKDELEDISIDVLENNNNNNNNNIFSDIINTIPNWFSIHNSEYTPLNQDIDNNNNNNDNNTK
jgi:hypothetical protein